MRFVTKQNFNIVRDIQTYSLYTQIIYRYINYIYIMMTYRLYLEINKGIEVLLGLRAVIV